MLRIGKSWLFMLVLATLFAFTVGEPRQRFKHSTRFCGLTKDATTWDGSCNVESYLKSLAKHAAPALTLLIFSVLATIMLVFFILCPCLRGYNRINKKTSLVLSVGLLIGIIGLILTQTGNASTSKVVKGLMSEVIEIVKEVQERLSDIRENVHGLPKFEDNEFLDEFDNISEEFDQIHDTIDQTLKSEILKYNKYREIVIHVIAVFPVIVMIITLIFMRLPFRPPLSFLGWFAMLLSIVIWGSLSMHVVAALLISDICYELEVGVETGELGIINTFFSCDDDSHVFSEIRRTMNERLDEAREGVCNLIGAFCAPEAACFPDYDFSTCIKDYGYIYSIPNLQFNTVGNERMSVRDCSQDIYCPHYEDTNELLEFSELQGKYIAFVDNVNENLDCSFVYKAFDVVKVKVCDASVPAFRQVFAGNAILGITMIIGSIVIVHIFKGSKEDEEGELYEMT